jgi:cell division septum initiation protein DivIVA
LAAKQSTPSDRALRRRYEELEAENAALLGLVQQLKGMDALELSKRTQELRTQAEDLQQQIREAEQKLASVRTEVVQTEEVALLQEAGIYEYQHPLTDAVAYKAELARLKDKVKTMTRMGDAVLTTTSWTVNGSAAEGRRMTRDFSKLMLRAYNAEADNLIRTMRPYKLASAIALDHTTVAALRRHHHRQQAELAALGTDGGGYVFTNTCGRPLGPDGLSVNFAKLLATSGLPPVRLHDLRHGAASLALQAGADLKVVQDQLGHSSIVLTADTYITVVPEIARKSAEDVARLILHAGRYAPGAHHPRRPSARPRKRITAPRDRAPADAQRTTIRLHREVDRHDVVDGSAPPWSHPGPTTTITAPSGR